MKLSILLVTYNRPHYLQQTLKSIEGYTGECEILVLDHGSTDGQTQTILNQYKCDPRFRFFRFDSNRGPEGDAWSFLLQHATGDYTILQADDDLLIPEAIPHKLAILERNLDISFVHSAVYIINESGVVSGLSHFGQVPRNSFDSLQFDELITANHVSLQSCIFRTETVKSHWGAGPKMGVLSDFALYLNILNAGGLSAYTIIPSVYVRLHTGSDSAHSGYEMVIHLLEVWKYWISKGWTPSETQLKAMEKSVQNLTQIVFRTMFIS